MTDQALLSKLGKMFDGVATLASKNEYEIESPGTYNARTLFDACVLLECKPEELFTTFDSESGGGCETCGYGGSPASLTLQVRR